MDDPSGLLIQEYHTCAQPRVNEAATWTNEVVPRWNDDEQGDLAEAVAGYGITDQYAAELVEEFDAYYRTQAEVEELPEGLTRVQELQAVVEQWGGTRYIDNALAVLSDRQA